MLSKLYKNSKSAIKNNNIITTLISVTELSSASIQTPNEQRIIIPDKITEIVKYQEDFFKSKKHFNFVGNININCCLADNKNYLIDGQHRYHAIKRLYNRGYKNEMIKIEIMEVNTYNEVIANYNLLNKNTPLPEFIAGIDEDIPKRAFISLRNEFPNIWKTCKKPKKPYINQNDFQEALGFLTLKLNELNIFPGGIKQEDLKELIIDKNNKMKLWPAESYEKIRKGVKWEQYKKEADKHGFYLGMYSSISQEYRYDWVSQVIEETSGDKLAKKILCSLCENETPVTILNLVDKYGDTRSRVQRVIDRMRNSGIIERVPMIDRIAQDIFSSIIRQYEGRGKEWLISTGGLGRLERSKMNLLMKNTIKGTLTISKVQDILSDIPITDQKILINTLGGRMPYGIRISGIDGHEVGENVLRKADRTFRRILTVSELLDEALIS